MASRYLKVFISLPCADLDNCLELQLLHLQDWLGPALLSEAGNSLAWAVKCGRRVIKVADLTLLHFNRNVV